MQGFYLGTEEFYQKLSKLSESERSKINMTSVGRINQLYGNESIRYPSARKARFINSGLKATLLGAVVSDGLEDGRVFKRSWWAVYNFVANGHTFVDGRSILTIRSTRRSGKLLESNILFNYGHITIPRHLRDIIVTEYGIGRSAGGKLMRNVFVKC